MVVFHFLTRNTRDTSEIFVSAARRKNDSTHCFFLRNEISIKWVYLQLGTKFTKFINRTYEEKKNTNKTRQVIFHYKLLCLLSPEAHKTKICCFISPLFG